MNKNKNGLPYTHSFSCTYPYAHTQLLLHSHSVLPLSLPLSHTDQQKEKHQPAFVSLSLSLSLSRSRNKEPVTFSSLLMTVFHNFNHSVGNLDDIPASDSQFFLIFFVIFLSTLIILFMHPLLSIQCVYYFDLFLFLYLFTFTFIVLTITYTDFKNIYIKYIHQAHLFAGTTQSSQ